MLAGPAPGRAAAVCPPANDHVWFLATVYDSARRNDFVLDLDSFEYFLAQLRETYCIPDSQAKILAFDNGYTRNGKTYEDGSEANFKSYLTAFGQAASQHPDSIVFVLESSHGDFYRLGGSNCPGRGPGSLAALRAGGGENGILYDCDVGAILGASFAPHVKVFTEFDCSFCGGFSDSITAASGTVPDGSLPVSSGIPGPNRIAVTGCAITTECFGSSIGAYTYGHQRRVLEGGVAACDGFTAPGFPTVQGADLPAQNGPLDGTCSASEWFFAAVHAAYMWSDPTERAIGIQQQFRIKYGMATLADDIRIL